MHRVTLKGLPLSDETKATLLTTPGISGAIVHAGPDKDTRILVYGPGCEIKDRPAARQTWPDAEFIWERSRPTSEVEAKGRTATALHALDEDPEMTPYFAAQYAGVNVSAVYRALARREAKQAAPKCQCCGRPLHATLAVAA